MIVANSLCMADRKDERLYGMFSGYKCKRGAVEEALRRCGVNLSKVKEAVTGTGFDLIPSWMPTFQHVQYQPDLAHFPCQHLSVAVSLQSLCSPMVLTWLALSAAFGGCAAGLAA